MRWSDSVTLKFVKLYLKHECLWNPQHKDYKMRNIREEAYAALTSEFTAISSKNLTILDVKNKIKNLRTTYIQQVDKILEKSSPDCLYEPSLVWFHEMDQCLKHLPINRHLSSYSAAKREPVDTSYQSWYEDEQQDNSNDSSPDPLVPEENDSEKETNIKTEPEMPPRKKKFKKKRSSDHKSPHKSASKSETRQDEFDIYGKYVASQLRQMGLQRALRIQLQIQGIISDARLLDT